ncbi:hypothetical protein ScPMuIL_015566 [Solemya velum]
MADGEGVRCRQQTNGDVKHEERDEGTSCPNFEQQMNLQRIRAEARRIHSEVVDQLNEELCAMFDTYINEIEHLSDRINTDGHLNFSSKSKKTKIGELPDKAFTTRRSLLTELFEVTHIRTIYHIFVAILIVFSLNTIVYDIIDKGRLVLDFHLMQWALGKFPKVISLWLCMKLATLLIVYPIFHYWSNNRKPGPMRLPDFIFLGIYVVYQTAFLVLPVLYIREHSMPPASAVVIATEQLRLMMKAHAFVRENTARVLAISDESKCATEGTEAGESEVCPDFSKYLYFLFAPTLVYRAPIQGQSIALKPGDKTPGTTPVIRWNYVVSNFAQVLACLFYTYYIFERFCVPVFRHFSQEHVTPKALLLSVFGCMLPATLVLIIGFFAILHSWLNAFAEMMRFGDRMFYKDWWNCTTFAGYYRTWNVVVHDWLYTYIYKDCSKVLGRKKRPMAMAAVFLISAVFHEYVIVLSFNFFYPVLFVMFAGAGFAFIFLTDKVNQGVGMSSCG